MKPTKTKEKITELRECCKLCEFPIGIQREPIFLTNDIFSIIHLQSSTCEGCGHQIDGSTIPIVYKLIGEIVNRKNEEKKQAVRDGELKELERIRKELKENIINNSIGKYGQTTRDFLNKIIDECLGVRE